MKTEKLENIIDKLMIERGDHPSRVRNPLYQEERNLAKSTALLFLEQQKECKCEEVSLVRHALKCRKCGKITEQQISYTNFEGDI